MIVTILLLLDSLTCRSPVGQAFSLSHWSFYISKVMLGRGVSTYQGETGAFPGAERGSFVSAPCGARL